MNSVTTQIEVTTLIDGMALDVQTVADDVSSLRFTELSIVGGGVATQW